MTNGNHADLEQQLIADIKELSKTVWPKRIMMPAIESWLNCFGNGSPPDDKTRLHALYLLSKFMYFGEDEIRGLLRCLFRDHFRYPVVASIRRNAADTRNSAFLESSFKTVLRRTRFLGAGGPSESGTHILYHYRQENSLSKDLFIGSHEIFNLRTQPMSLAFPDVTQYVFLDDFCGSGQQATDYLQDLAIDIANAAKASGVAKPTTRYHVLIGTREGINRVRGSAGLDTVSCALDLDNTFRVFDVQSRYFRNCPDEIEQQFAEVLASFHGSRLWSHHPLGYEDSQLMLGFVHNTPDNTLPIFWDENDGTWHPLFRRYGKF